MGGPFGAVKEQSSGLYAQTMAERGYVALAFDASFTGESGGEPRNVASPDINTEDFMAAVDFLGLHPLVDRERIGVIGICGWGGMALNAVAADKRVKAVVASTMYDMTRVMSKGYNDSVTAEQRAQTLEQLSRQRWKDAANGKPAYQPDYNKLKGGEAQFMVDYHDYYMTKRGYHPRAVNSGNAWTMTTPLSFMNMPILSYIKEISPRPDPVHPRRERPLALLQRNRLRGRGAAEGTDDRQGRQSRRPLRPPGQDPVRCDRRLLRPAPEGTGVTKHAVGDLVAVGCLVDSDHTCANCLAGRENLCPNQTLTFGSPDRHGTAPMTYGGYSNIGDIAQTQEMLDFCGAHHITADVEVIDMQQVNEAWQRLEKCDVKYRFVIDVASLKAA